MLGGERNGVRDPVRLAAVRATGLLDAPRDEALRRLTQLAAALLRADAAHITLVDEVCTVRVAAAGRHGGELVGGDEEADAGLCHLVLCHDDAVLVADTARDPRTPAASSRLTHAVGAWAGAPVRSADGHALGTLSVVERRPRCWSEDDAHMLRTLAGAVSDEIALRVARRRNGDGGRAADFEASLLRATHDSTVDGVLVVSPDGDILWSNARFAELWSIPDAVVEQGTDAAALDSVVDKLVDPDAFLARVREVYASRAPSHDELRLRDGRVFDRYGTPLFGSDGAYHGYAWYTRDVTAERQAREALEASDARYRSLVRALASEVWYASASGELLSDMPSWRAVTGQTREQLLGAGWLDGVHPGDRGRVADAWARAQQRGDLFETEYRICAPDGSGVRRLTVRGVPLEHDGVIDEWVGVYVDVTDLRAAEDAKEQLAALAASAADGTRALHEVSAALSSAVTLADVLAVVLEQGQSRLGATGSGVALRDGDRVHYEALRGYSADIKAQWSEFSMAEPLPTTYVIGTGRPVFVESRDDLDHLYDNDRLRGFVEATGEHAWARLPLRTPSGVLGALIFGFDRPRRFSEDERNFAMALAGQCAQAIERARLYERERSTAQVLQRSLLPDALPALPGVHLSAVCQPASADVEVGGDWYDAFMLGDGRLAVVVGDVMGKGVRAASVMGQVRNALRGLVHADAAPDRVLSWLDSVVGQLGSDEELVTMVYGLFDASSGQFEWCSAGHMPPLLINRGTAAYVVGGDSLPLGLAGERDVGRLVLEPDQALLLFSDGLVESRARPLVDGLDELAARAGALAAADASGDIDSFRDRLVASMIEPTGNDDVTALVLRRSAGGRPEGDPVRTAEVVLPARASSAGAARRFVTERLGDWDLGHLADAALVCVSEIVTNAVVHAKSHAEVSMRAGEGVLRFDVRDVGSSGIPTIRPPASPDDTHGRGLLLVEALSDRWGTIGEGDSKVVWFEMSTDSG